MNSYINLNFINSLKKSGAILLDFNGVVPSDLKVSTHLIKVLIELLNQGFKIIINTNSNSEEIICTQKSLLKYNNSYFLNSVKKKMRKNIFLYSDNRTAYYYFDIKKNAFIKDGDYSKDKFFSIQTEKNIIKNIISKNLKDLTLDRGFVSLHPDKKIPEYNVIDKKAQIRIDIKFPQNSFYFGNYIVKRLYEELKKFNIEVHLDKRRIYITIGNLHKSLAIEDAIIRHNLRRDSILYIGDKFTDDEDGNILNKSDILCINVGDYRNIKNSKLINIQGNSSGTLKVLSKIFYLSKIKSEKKIVTFEYIQRKIEGGTRIIGVNGAAGSGKTTFAKELKQYLSFNYNNVIIIHMDWFIKNRDKRNEYMEQFISNKRSINKYTETAWDVHYLESILFKIRMFLSQPEKNMFSLKINNAYNRENGLNDLIIHCDIFQDTIFLLEGTEVINNYTKNYFDFKIQIIVDDNNLLLDRILKREKNKQDKKKIPDDFIVARFNNLDLHHSNYLNSLYPDNYHLLINNTNFDYEKISGI